MVIAACNASTDIPAELEIGDIWSLFWMDFVASGVASIKRNDIEFDNCNTS
jgi:hypothetical protein